MKEYNEDELRRMFEDSYAKELTKYADGCYVLMETSAAWLGFKNGFKKAAELVNKPGLGYVAIRENKYNTNLWVIALKTLYDDKSIINPYMDNVYLDLSLPNFHQNSNNTFRCLGMGDGEYTLVKLGFEVINDPKYRFTYEAKDKDLPREIDS